MAKEAVILDKKQPFYANGERVVVKNADEVVKKKLATRPPKPVAKKKPAAKSTAKTTTKATETKK